MRIDKKLNLVVPVETEKGTIHVHSEPIGTATFKRYFLELSKTFARMHNEELGIAAGPRVASMMLERVATELGTWEGEGGVATGLMAEIRRLTNAVVPGPGGWEIVPWQQVVDQHLLSDEEVEEVENAIVFFIVASAMYRKGDREIMIRGAAKLWDARVESLNSTELANSLRTSTRVASTGETATASSIPS